MPDTPGDGQVKKPAAPGAGAETPAGGGGPDPTKPNPSAEPQPGSSAPPPEAGGQNAQHPQKIIIDGKEYSVNDLDAIIKAKSGLEQKIGEQKTKLDELEARDLSDKEKLEKQNKELQEQNTKFQKQILNTKIQRKLDEKNVQIRADIWNHSITEENQIDEAVQNLIKENPGIVKAAGKPSPGKSFDPPGSSASPGEAPAGTDQEKELTQKYDTAKTLAELENLDKEYGELTGRKPPEGRQAI